MKQLTESSVRHLLKNLRGTGEKAPAFLSTSGKSFQANGMTLIWQQNNLVMESSAKQLNPSTGSNDGQQPTGRIRRLTPTECARLQTIPDWYKWQCSNAQQYKMLGNGWTVEVIKHIFSFISADKAKTDEYKQIK